MESRRRRKSGYCYVPQCIKYKRPGTFFFTVPKHVQSDPILSNKWLELLKIMEYPKRCLICSHHFDKKSILIPVLKSKNMKTRLAKGAFPCRNLPSDGEVNTKQKSRAAWLEEYIAEIEYDSERNSETSATSENIEEVQELFQENRECNEAQLQEEFLIKNEGEQTSLSIGVQCSPITIDKAVQISSLPYISIASLWDTNKKLNNMTGIPSLAVLDVLEGICRKIRHSEKCLMTMRDRICLTLYKLKSNSSFAELAILFHLCDRTAKLYFADTIQLLAKGTKSLIYWQTKKENNKSLPKCFRHFPNVRTVLDCTEVKTATMGCLSCRVCTYSHYKGTHTLKFLIGVSPSGSINYLSRVVTGKSSDKAIKFNLTDLIEKLEEGDAVLVDNGFMIGDELSKAGVEMIRPKFFFENFSKSDVEKCTRIASARVHVERRISRITQFRVLADKVCVSVIPYIDDIVSVLCGLSNITLPILSDERF